MEPKLLVKRTSIDHQLVELDGNTVSLYDAEWYDSRNLYFDTREKAELCYNDTVAILVEAHNRLTEAGWSQASNWNSMAPEEEIR